MSQVLEQPEGRRRRRRGWWLFTAVALLLVAASVRLIGDDGGSSEVLGAGAGKSTPSTEPTEVLGATASRPGLEAPTITGGPADGSPSGRDVRFTYSHPQTGVNFACSLDNAPFARCPKDGISYRGLADGPHFFAVAVQQGNGPLSAPASRSWTVGAPQPQAPPVPVITVGPPASTIEPDATFIFTNSRTGVTFECRLDSGPFEPCTSPKAYADLAAGPHTFFVRATDSTGTSPVAQYPWTIVTAGFGISGSLAADQLLAPGVTWPLNLVFTNPYSNAKGVNVTSVGFTVNNLTVKDEAANPDCIGSDNVVIADPGTAWPLNLLHNSTKSLSDLGVPQSAWPKVTMLDLDSNQDACKNSVFTFSYTGTAEK